MWVAGIPNNFPFFCHAVYLVYVLKAPSTRPSVLPGTVLKPVHNVTRTLILKRNVAVEFLNVHSSPLFWGGGINLSRQIS